MPDLPTNAIGLVAFILLGAGYAVRYLTIQNQKTIETFMTYIEKKNGNLERTTKLFTETIEEQTLRHKDAMINQNDRHREMLDDFAARLEGFVVTKK